MYINIAPGPVLGLSYEEDTDTSVSITWKPPKEPNGDIVAYFVEHGVYQNESTTSVRLLATGGPMYTVIRALSELLLFYTYSIHPQYTWEHVSASVCASHQLLRGPQSSRQALEYIYRHLYSILIYRSHISQFFKLTSTALSIV